MHPIRLPNGQHAVPAPARAVAEVIEETVASDSDCKPVNTDQLGHRPPGDEQRHDPHVHGGTEPNGPVDRGNERYRWRCYLCQLFAKQYQPDAARAKLARDYAYSQRFEIYKAFDRGVIKR